MSGSMIGWFLRNPMIDEGLKFLLRADFNGPDLAAGNVPSSLGWPYVSIGGPLTVVQDDGQFLIENGKVVFAAQSTPNWEDQGLVGGSLTREPGLALFSKSVLTSGDQISIQWQYAPNTPISPTQSDLGLWTRSNYFRESQSILTISNTDPDSLDAIFSASILRQDGGYVLLREGTTGEWKLAWVLEDANNNDTVCPTLANYTRVGALDSLRAARLPGTKGDMQPGNGFDIWGHRDLDTTDAISGNIITASTWKHTADFYAEWDSDISGSGATDVVNAYFRYVSGSYHIRVKTTGTGTISLFQNGGLLASGSGVVNGSRIALRVIGTDVIVWVDGNPQIVETLTADNGLTATDGVITIAGTAAASDLVVQTLDGIANVGSPNHPGYGIATAVLPSPYPVGTTGVTFTHEANCVIRWTQNTQYAANVYIRFRKQDDNNYLRLQVYDANLNLHEYVDGSPTYLAGGTGITAGKKITVMADGATISAWAGTTLLFTYPTATHFQTATAGEINFVGTGQLISNPIAWPRTFASAPNTPGAARALIALKRLEA